MLEFVLAIAVIAGIPFLPILLIHLFGQKKAGNPPLKPQSKDSRCSTGYWREPPRSYSSVTLRKTPDGGETCLTTKESTDNNT